MLNSNGDKTDPCGNLILFTNFSPFRFFNLQYAVSSCKNCSTKPIFCHSSLSGLTCLLLPLYISPSLHTESFFFSKSVIDAIVTSLPLNPFTISLGKRSKAWVVPLNRLNGVQQIRKVYLSIKVHKGNKPHSVHVLGDFNFGDIVWPDRHNKCRSPLSRIEGQILVDIINDHGCDQLVHFPTRERNTLDLIITSPPNQFVDIHSPDWIVSVIMILFLER